MKRASGSHPFGFPVCLVLVLGCSSEHAPSSPRPPPIARGVAESESADAAPPAVHAVGVGELEPGTIRAFGLLMPEGAIQQFANDQTRIFVIQTTMPRVMRYLQHRLDIMNAEIHPLGAMMRNAHIRTTAEGESLFVDVGVREEGDRTLVTVWNRTAMPLAPRSNEEGLRAAGIDPRTGRPLPDQNR